MTLCLGLNSDNDIYLGADGNLVLQSGINAVATACGTITKSSLGEMVLTSTQGIPYFQSVWRGVPNLGIWQSYLKNMLQNVDGVIEVNNLSILSRTGTLSYVATIRTTFGTTQITG